MSSELKKAPTDITEYFWVEIYFVQLVCLQPYSFALFSSPILMTIFPKVSPFFMISNPSSALFRPSRTCDTAGTMRCSERKLVAAIRSACEPIVDPIVVGNDPFRTEYSHRCMKAHR